MHFLYSLPVQEFSVSMQRRLDLYFIPAIFTLIAFRNVFCCYFTAKNFKSGLYFCGLLDHHFTE